MTPKDNEFDFVILLVPKQMVILSSNAPERMNFNICHNIKYSVPFFYHFFSFGSQTILHRHNCTLSRMFQHNYGRILCILELQVLIHAWPSVSQSVNTGYLNRCTKPPYCSVFLPKDLMNLENGLRHLVGNHWLFHFPNQVLVSNLQSN